jgi:hypothetical protein
MIDKIIKMYKVQCSLYSEIFEILNSSTEENKTAYKEAIENVKTKFEKIDVLNRELDIVKNEYVKIKGISDFNGKEIARVEEKEKYAELKKIIEETGKTIKAIKKLQDNFIAGISEKTFETPKASNNALNIYKKRMKDKNDLQKNTYFDKLK